MEGSVIVEKVRNDKNPSGGYNAATEEYVDMIKAGIIDPTKVSRCALQNAASVAGLMLTTEVMITELPEEKKEPAGGGRWTQPRHGRHVLRRRQLSNSDQLAVLAKGSAETPLGPSCFLASYLR